MVVLSDGEGLSIVCLLGWVVRLKGAPQASVGLVGKLVQVLHLHAAIGRELLLVRALKVLSPVLLAVETSCVHGTVVIDRSAVRHVDPTKPGLPRVVHWAEIV